MRIVSDPKHPDFFRNKYRVDRDHILVIFLDGAQVEGVREADDEAGYVIIDRLDLPLVNECIQTERLTGRVHISGTLLWE